MTDYKKIQILGVYVDTLTRNQVHQEIDSIIHQNEKALILNVNVNCLNLATSHPSLRNFLNSARIVFCDGAGVILGARLLNYSIPDRITYAEWIWQLAAIAEARHYSLFLLGDTQEVVKRTRQELTARFPELNVVGFHHGFFDKTIGSIENEEVINQINKAQPNILLGGFGMPLQERWLMENWGKIDANIALTGGAVFKYASGELRRAPRWMTDHGLEWLGRLIIEPRRLWKRYLVGNPIFFWHILQQRFGREFTND